MEIKWADCNLSGITFIAVGVEPSNCARVGALGGRPAATPYMSH
jgi:hypothetical protein